MGRKVVTAADVEAVGAGGRLVVAASDLVTPLATDAAAEIGVVITRSSDAPASGDDVAHGSGAETASATAGLEARVRELVIKALSGAAAPAAAPASVPMPVPVDTPPAAAAASVTPVTPSAPVSPPAPAHVNPAPAAAAPPAPVPPVRPPHVWDRAGGPRAFVTEADLRRQLPLDRHAPGHGDSVTVAAGARLSPAAADLVAQWGLTVVEEGATPATAVEPPPVAVDEPAAERAWNTPSVFPLSPPATACTQCGSAVENKPSWLTQLNAAHYVPKNHPRIVLRGLIDDLHARVLAATREALDAEAGWLARDLETIAAYCRELMSAEYNERLAADLGLDGWDTAAIHAASHNPRKVLGIDHLTLDGSAPPLQHTLNLLRTQVRQVEIAALTAFESPHHPGASVCLGLNRLSSAFYVLQLRLAATLSPASTRATPIGEPR